MALPDTKTMSLDFEERQRLTNWLPWTIVLSTLVLTISILIYQLITGDNVGDRPASNLMLILIISVFQIPLILSMLLARLIIRVDNEFLYYGWNLPTNDLNKINIADISTTEIINYKFLSYGYGLTKKYGTVYNASGNQGLLIKKQSGEKILLGTRKAQKLADTLNNLKTRHSL
jgi:hypothetical protein